MKKLIKKYIDNTSTIIGVAIGVAAIVMAPAAYAVTTSSANSQLTQQINNGVLSTDVRNASNAIVPSPSFAMSAVSVSTSQQTATGTLGSNSQRISVDNPGGATNGWTLALNATTPGTGTWTAGANTYAYNGSAATGQLTVDPSMATLTVNTGTNTGITKGTSSAFTGSTAITLMTAGSTASQIWNGYLTGIGMSQAIPASQPSGAYTINLTQTATSS